MEAVNPAELLRRHGLRPKKEWGQNFLGDEGVLARLAALARLQPGDQVVELGAGLGHFTRALAATGARVVAVERDRDLAPVLRAELPSVEVIEA
ncbi:MAG: rRNA adenine N-6-methyltransferase family protein, partial [Deltaproteobacteria bacterium]